MISNVFNNSVLNGLVLAGGKSLRMGTDKSKIIWHGKEQQYYLSDILKKYCTNVYISKSDCAPDNQYSFIIDKYENKGPINGILSALAKNPNNAWLVIACDLPLFSEIAIADLIKERNVSKVATAYESPRDQSPEPLAAIWEPKAFKLLYEAMKMGVTCPRKFLLTQDIKIVQPKDPSFLKNANTPEEFIEIIQKVDK